MCGRVKRHTHPNQDQKWRSIIWALLYLFIQTAILYIYIYSYIRRCSKHIVYRCFSFGLFRKAYVTANVRRTHISQWRGCLFRVRTEYVLEYCLWGGVKVGGSLLYIHVFGMLAHSRMRVLYETMTGEHGWRCSQQCIDTLHLSYEFRNKCLYRPAGV